MESLILYLNDQIIYIFVLLHTISNTFFAVNSQSQLYPVGMGQSSNLRVVESEGNVYCHLLFMNGIGCDWLW